MAGARYVSNIQNAITNDERADRRPRAFCLWINSIVIALVLKFTLSRGLGIVAFYTQAKRSEVFVFGFLGIRAPQRDIERI